MLHPARLARPRRCSMNGSVSRFHGSTAPLSGDDMKLVRYGQPGAEKPGLIDGQGTLRDLSGEIGDIDGAALQPAALAHLASLEPARLPAVTNRPRLGPAINRIGKIVAIGLNYADHAAETGAKIPAEPIVF